MPYTYLDLQEVENINSVTGITKGGEERDDTHFNECFIFCYSPSLGTLDNWISILYHLRQKRPDAEFIFFIPIAYNAVDQIDLDNVLIRLSSGIFDRIVFQSRSGLWFTTSTFEQAKRMESAYHSLKLAASLFQKMHCSLGVCLTRKVHQMLLRLKPMGDVFTFDFFPNRNAILLYDVSEARKPYNAELMTALSSSPKFSVWHGLGFFDNNDIISFKKSNIDWKNELTRNTVTYLYSESNRAFFQTIFVFKDDAMRALGIPRHDSDWIKFLVSQEDDRNLPFSDGFIFVISEWFENDFDRYEKQQQQVALENIRQVSLEYELKVVVKLHPGEVPDGRYERIFGKKNYGKTWVYSNLHPFTLGTRCVFAVSFTSGVSIDLIMLGVPTIEHLDLRGKAEDEVYSLRDEHCEPATKIRYYGLALGANDYRQFKQHVDDIMNNRQMVVARLQVNYAKQFLRTPHINEVIATDICRVLDDRKQS